MNEGVDKLTKRKNTSVTNKVFFRKSVFLKRDIQVLPDGVIC